MKKDLTAVKAVHISPKDDLDRTDISVAHKALLQWEKNVNTNKFEYSYLYNYPVDSQYAVIAITPPLHLTGKKIEIWFKYQSTFPYKFMVDDKEVFVADKLRDIIKWLGKLEQAKVLCGKDLVDVERQCPSSNHDKGEEI